MSIQIDASKGIRQNTTEVTKIPVGTTAQRPASPQAGMMRFNTDTGQVEGYNAVAEQWQPISGFFGAAATGGTVTDITQDGKLYRVHTFTSDGTFDVTRGGEVEYLVVAGGGGGGFDAGGGGGAGGYLSSVVGELSGENTGALSRATVTAASFPVVVGGGGGAAGSVGSQAGDGGNSSAFGVTANGGGGAGSKEAVGRSGGSGGGSGHGSASFRASGLAGQGFRGGDRNGSLTGGGGGGAGQEGQNGQSSIGGKGGDGIESSITGTPTFRAGGGGGGNFSGSDIGGAGGLGNGGRAGGASTGPIPPTANTGGGGQSQGNASQPGATAGAAGIVIVRYRIG